jgi:hypothetical protein
MPTNAALVVEEQTLASLATGGQATGMTIYEVPDYRGWAGPSIDGYAPDPMACYRQDLAAPFYRPAYLLDAADYQIRRRSRTSRCLNVISSPSRWFSAGAELQVVVTGTQPSRSAQPGHRRP